ncbi:MAG: MFS transporter [Chloroflexaceae bacterium]|nr:MFS transporter [Chloroflexaceae bacterium]
MLLSNFLLNLGASSFEIGLLSAFSLVANLLQPMGAYWAERATSRRWYGFWIYFPARSLWLLVILGIIGFYAGLTDRTQLIRWTLLIVAFSYALGALGSASWMSWMTFLIPRRLRGVYFGFRNSGASFTGLISVPLLGQLISRWPGGSLEGYAIALAMGTTAGLLGIASQGLMVDVNPQLGSHLAINEEKIGRGWRQDPNFLRFLLFYGLWLFAINFSAPFFNVYLLQTLGLDIEWVTVYNSLSAGANLLMLVTWGKLADRVGNLPIIAGAGVMVAMVPLLWLTTSDRHIFRWLGFPLLYLLLGTVGSGVDTLQCQFTNGAGPSATILPLFCDRAALGGVGGVLGAMAGGLFLELGLGGFSALFLISTGLRFLALVPLLLVRDHRSVSLWQRLFPQAPVLKT